MDQITVIGPSRVVPWLSVSCVALGAFLLFAIEPLVAKAELPWFGGSPAVWCSTLVFFQGVLLAGYGYSHLLLRLPPKVAAVAHVVLLATAALLLPTSLAPASTDPPVLALVRTLFVKVGLPFFALSTTSTLSQAWYTRSTGREPWSLYAASNAASLAALLAYPFLVEPTLGLSTQLSLWRAGVVVWSGFLAVLALVASRAVAPAASSLSLGTGELVRWAAAPALASALLTAVSYKLAADIAAIPLLFVAPLALYLLSFVLAFEPRVPRPGLRLEVLGLVGIVLALNLATVTSAIAIWLHLAVLLGPLFVWCWILHADVASIRPPAARLSAFYLALSVGGFVGGLATTLLAPLLFDDVSEFPLLLAVTAVMLTRRSGSGRSVLPVTTGQWASSAAAIAVIAAGVVLMRLDVPGPWRLLPFGALVYAVARFRTPGQFVPVACVMAFLAAGGLLVGTYRVVDVQRSFFGVSRIVEDEKIRVFVHGTTVHGSEDFSRPDIFALSYHHASTPLGATLRAQKDGARIGVVGLGAGALAAHARKGQFLTFYEIDPVVEPLARRWFRYLDGSLAETKVILGDARLTLAATPPGSFDLLVMDAFTGDSVPVHLLTREAVAMYMERLAPGGILQMHITNRNLTLAPLVRGVAREAGLVGRIASHTPDDVAAREGADPTIVTSLAREEASLAALPDVGWVPLDDGGDAVVWTDERSSILDVVRWLKL